MSCHVPQVTMSPHHWCDNSCEFNQTEKLDWLVMVWCSMPPPHENWP
jgi:hypothetical protein